MTNYIKLLDEHKVKSPSTCKESYFAITNGDFFDLTLEDLLGGVDKTCWSLYQFL